MPEAARGPQAKDNRLKVLFASDHPVLSFERCLGEAAALPFREGVLEKYLRENALALFR
jgi:predicted TIM-barrel fold metal-dependent hydrolase